MPRHESDREDLLREATALVERVELQASGFDESIVAGFRRDGSASFFFGAEPVFQFNSTGEFRRGYIDGLLYKAEQGRLVALQRQRSDREVILQRTELSSEETAAILVAASGHFARLGLALGQAPLQIIGEVPPGADVIGRVRQWIASLPTTIRVAQSPHAR